eukprot:tig00021319_g20210.t1
MARSGAAPPYAKLDEPSAPPAERQRRRSVPDSALPEEPAELLCCGVSCESAWPRGWRPAYLFGPAGDCLFPPNSMFARHLGYCMLSIFFYNIFGLPFRLAFLQQEIPWLVTFALMVVDYLGDLILVLYIIVKMRTVTSARDVADPYAFSRAFYRDVIGVIPIEIVAYAAGARLALAYRFNRFLYYWSISNFTSAWERRATHANQLRLARTCVTVLILVHWVACMYMSVVSYEGFGINKWAMPDEPLLRNNVDARYMYSFYWALAFMFGVSGDDLGSPRTRLELYFTAGVIVTGFSVVAAVVGNVYVTMTDGEYFGEIALLYADKRTASVRAKTYCDLFTLHKHDLDEVLMDYPEMHAMLREIARSRATEGRVKASKNAQTPGTSGSNTPHNGGGRPSSGPLPGRRASGGGHSTGVEPSGSIRHGHHGHHGQRHSTTANEFQQQVRIHRAQWALRVLRRFVRAWLMFKRGQGGPNIGNRPFKSIFDVYQATKLRSMTLLEGDPDAIDALASNSFARVNGSNSRRHSGDGMFNPPMFTPPPYVQASLRQEEEEGAGDADEAGGALTARSDASGVSLASPRPLLPHTGLTPRPPPDEQPPQASPTSLASVLGPLWEWATGGQEGARRPPPRPDPLADEGDAESSAAAAARRGRGRSPAAGRPAPLNAPGAPGGGFYHSYAYGEGPSDGRWGRAQAMGVGQAGSRYGDDDGGGYTRYVPAAQFPGGGGLPPPATYGRATGGRAAGLAGNLDAERVRRMSGEWAAMNPVPVSLAPPTPDPRLLDSDDALIGCLPNRRPAQTLPARAQRQPHAGRRPPSPSRSDASSPNTIPASFEV